MRYTVPAVIFAGGRSTRMGQDKALLPFGGFSSLAAYQYDKLSRYFDTVYLSSKEEKFDFDAPVILDRYQTPSPLAGIVSVFETLESDRIFILSVDTPFVDMDIIKALMDRAASCDAVIARTHGKVHPLCGVYVHTLLPVFKAALNKQHHKLTKLLEEVDTHYVDFEANEKTFMNLNHPHEYEEAQKRIVT